MKLREEQKGVLLLATSLVVLLMMGIAALMLEARALQQLKVATKDYRGEQALAVAEAGLNYGVAYVIETPTGADAPATTDLSFTTINAELGSGVGKVIALTSSKVAPDEYEIVAAGESEDGLVTRTVEHTVHVTEGDPDASGYKFQGWRDY